MEQQLSATAVNLPREKLKTNYRADPTPQQSAMIFLKI